MFNHSTVKIVTSHKHLGVHLTSSLDWSEHVHNICLQANRKLSVLRSVKHLNRKTLDVLYKLTVRSVIDYSLPLFGGNLRQSELFKLNQLQYRAAKVVSGALHYTSKEKLNIELGWETISNRYHILGLSLFRKIIHFDTRPLILTYKPDLSPPTNTRQGPQYKPFPFLNVKMSNSFFPYFTKLWNSLDKSLKSEPDICIFKTKLKDSYKPTRMKHFERGTQPGNRLLTRLRLNRSFLRDNSFAIGLSDTTTCDCLFIRESTAHFIQDCTLYNSERQTLYRQVIEILPTFQTLGKKQQLDSLLNGFNKNNPDFLRINTFLQFKVQSFILKTKRFGK